MKKSFREFRSYFFLPILFISSLTVTPLLAQSSLEWRGDIGLRHFSRNSFLSNPASWRYTQGIAEFSLSGVIWDPRFMQFNVGGNFNYTHYGGNTGGSNYRNFGYRLESLFFPKGKFSLGLRFVRDNAGTVGRDSESLSLKNSLNEKGISLSLSRIKGLPSVRLAYVGRTYRSSVNDSPRNERDNFLDLGMNKSAGISSFNLDYRHESYENQVIDRDRKHQNLRATERLYLKGGTSVWFNAILRKDSLALPSGGIFGSSYRQVSGNVLSRITKRLRGNLRYSYTHNYSSIDGRNLFLNIMTSGFHYSLSKNLTLSPLFNFSHSRIESPEGEDVLKGSQIGARLTWNPGWESIRWRLYLEFDFRQQDSRQHGELQDLAKALGANISIGNFNSVLASLSYAYSGADAEISIPEYGDPLYYFGIGTNLNRHAVRLEFRSRALRPLDTYLYSRYDNFERDLYGQGVMETTTSNHGLRLGLGRLSLAADYGTSDLEREETTARYITLTSTLDYNLSRSLSLRAMFVQRKRRDIVFGRDYNRSLSVFLNYNLPLFRASLIYQNLTWELDGPLRRNAVLSITVTRSFGTRR